MTAYQLISILTQQADIEKQKIADAYAQAAMWRNELDKAVSNGTEAQARLAQLTAVIAHLQIK